MTTEEKKREYKKRWRLKNPEKAKAAQKVWYKNQGAEHENNYYHEKRDKTKLRANWAVKRAIQAGKLVKKPCEVCEEIKVEAHHHKGYDPENYLSVQWLCRKHHYQVEGRLST